MSNYIEFDKKIDNSEIEDIDSIIDSSEEKTDVSDSENTETMGVIDISSIDNDDLDEYVPTSVQSYADSKINSIVSEKLKYMATSDSGYFAEKRKQIIAEVEAYKKNLIISKGFTDEEAEAAANKRAEKIATEADYAYKQEHPETAVIRVSKNEADKVVIDPEDQQKVHRASSIKLIEVEDRALKHIKIKKRDTKTPFNVAQLSTCVLAKQSVPCINTGDICTFTGTSSYSLVSLFFDENESNYQKLSKQIALAYEKFISSTTKTKFTVNGELAMTQEDFANWLSYPDLAAALYAIYVASSTEMLTSPFECQNETCFDIDPKEPKKKSKHSYKYTYNCKELMDFTEIPEQFQKVLDGIKKREGDAQEMLKFQSTINEGHRYQSTITKNIYDIEVPSCARALEFQRFIKNDDRLSETFANIAMYISGIYVYIGEEDGEPVYSEITDSEEIYQVVSNAIEPEFQLYYKKLIPDKAYIYSFKITTKCDKCGHEHTMPVDVASLVFLKAQGMEAEIE